MIKTATSFVVVNTDPAGPYRRYRDLPFALCDDHAATFTWREGVRIYPITERSFRSRTKCTRKKIPCTQCYDAFKSK